MLLASAVCAASSAASPLAQGQESWDAIYVSSTKVGHTHVKVANVSDAKGRKLLRVQVNTVLSYKRGRDRVNIEMRYGTIETLDGAVLRLDVRTLTGREELRTAGDLVEDGTAMKLTLEGGGGRQETRLPWSDDIRGPYAAEQSLARKPIAAGEARELKMFIPVLNQVCLTRLEAKGPEPVVLGGGVSRNLMRVEQTVRDADNKPLPENDQTLWIDDGGQVFKSRSPFLGGIDAYRTTRAAAMAVNGTFDLLTATIFKLDRPLANPTGLKRAVYRLTLTEGDLTTLVPSDQRQSLSASDPLNGTLEVRSETPGAGATEPEPGPEFLRPNALINSDDSRVVTHARAAVGAKTDPMEKAAAIQDWVWRNLRKKNFETVFATAREVARDLEGDCTEHGVLTAAMCRASGLPCRVVVGLVYVPYLGGFGPHLWNEVYAGGRWVAIDATFNQSSVDATHIKLAESSLDGVAPFEAFMPVMRVVSRLTIQAIEPR
jgi:hypothetical protein